ncbi:MAG: VanZ family protein [bacterium]|nr:MAG: VanZ family protein [bacterium]
MNSRTFVNYSDRILLVTCIIVVLITLAVGLRPLRFHYPNRALWLEDGRGIQFLHRGIAFTRDSIDLDRGLFTIMFLVEPFMENTWGVDHILELFDGEEISPLIVAQWQSELIIRVRDQGDRRGYSEWAMGDVLRPGGPRLLAITAGSSGVSFYRDGELLRLYPGDRFGGEGRPLRGRLIVGNSAEGRGGWTGSLFYLMVTDRALSGQEVREKYLEIAGGGQPQANLGPVPLYEYDFQEGDGKMVANRRGDAGAIEIPDTFRGERQRILMPPWRGFHLSRADVLDIIINTLGFIPLGFLLSLYLTAARMLAKKTAYFLTAAAGISLSLFIEVFQAFIPVRHSSARDLILNALGTMIGIAVLHMMIRSIGRQGED